MKRASALVATLAASLLAATAQSAEIVGTIVSTDPTANTVVVRSADGRETVYRTVETTRIQQGGSVVELRTLQPGTPVQIVAEPTPPPAATTNTIVYPVASGIVVAPPSPPPVSAEPRRSRDREVDSERDVDIDIEEDHEEDDD